MSALSGIITPLVTPFCDDGALDCESLERLVEFQIVSGVHGLFLFGSSGEFAALTESQRDLALVTVIRAAAGKAPVLVGVSDNSTVRVIERCRQALDCGAQGLVITAPFYHVNSQSEIVDHFSAIHAAVRLPIYAYDVPVLAKAKIEPKTVKKLASDGVISGLKDSSGDMSGLRQIIIETAGIEGFSVFTGMELLVDTALLMGASGAVAGLANVAPRDYVELFDACELGDWERAVSIQTRLTRLFDIVYIGAPGGGYSAGALSAFKAALVCRGILKTPKMAAPMRSLDREGVEKVRQMLQCLQFSTE
ncbi:MAG: dihydrodipicolinate synthase family protein [Clostridia bacterium]|nr:dihydrodipicolinate synthase family protein [Clostridia bacterium]